MPELKKIRVREAKARDIGLFKKLWLELLEKQHSEGSVVLAGDQTLAFYEALYTAYIDGRFEGVIFFVADKGVLMWGDSGSPLQYPGKTVTAWGHMAHDDKINEALLEAADTWAKEKGFEGIIAQTPVQVPPSDGFTPFAALVYRVIDSE
jgi:hypothetical protein